MSINDEWVRYLRASGYTGSLNDMMRQALLSETSVDPAPIACTITLTGDIAAVFGGQPLDISGQTVSKTVPASPANLYVAGGPIAFDWLGWRAFGYQASDFTTASASFHGVAVVHSASSLAQIVWNTADSSWLLSLVVGGSASGYYLNGGSSTSKVGLRVNGATGDVEVYIGDSTTTQAEIPDLAGLFNGVPIVMGPLIGIPELATLAEGDTYEAQIYTSAADLADFGLPAGTLDWCGNQL